MGEVIQTILSSTDTLGGGAVQTWRPSQDKGIFLPLLWCCITAASNSKSWIALGLKVPPYI